jgi:hypothetical protein
MISLLECDKREWRIIPKFSAYEISNDGLCRRIKTGRVLKHNLTAAGYPSYCIKRDADSKFVTAMAHRLVAIAFLPPPREGEIQVLHDDDNVFNCRVGNLKWGTPKINVADAIRNGLKPLGENHPCHRKPWTRPRGEENAMAKLTEASVRLIIRDDRPLAKIAKDYGVSCSLIHMIKHGQAWKHITNPSYRAMLEDGRKADAATA